MNAPKQFIKHLDIKPTEKKPKKGHLFFKFSMFFFLASLLAFAVYGIMIFIDTHDFRSPVIFQNPVPLKQIDLKSPLGTQSGMIKQAEAKVLTPREYVEQETIEAFGKSHVEAMNTLIQKESSYNIYAMNKSSGACGLFQFNPCSKLLKVCPNLDDLACVVREGISYIKTRYINPTGALAFHYRNGYY